jgi:biopolymer transport protein TolR
MVFGNKNDQEAMSEINVTPLVDVMLVLLVVFIVTAPLLTQSVGVNLPKTVAAAPPPDKPVTMVSIDAAGGLYLDKEKLDAERLGQKLGERQAQNPALTVQFEVDETVSYGKAAEVLAIAQHAGITRLSLQTRP